MIGSDWILALAPLAGLATNVIVQIASAHLARLVGVSIVAGLFCGLAATAMCTGFGSPTLGVPDVIAAWVTAIATYVAFSFGYWAFLNLNISGLRIRTLRELLREPGGISRNELMARYSAQEFLGRRLQRLQRGKQLSYRDGRWRLGSPALLVVAHLMAVARAVALPARAHPGRHT